MTPLFCRKKTLFLHDFYVTRPLFRLSTIAQKSHQSAWRWRVLAFYRIAPCLSLSFENSECLRSQFLRYLEGVLGLRFWETLFRGGSRGWRGAHPPPPPEMTCGFLIQLVFTAVHQSVTHSLLVQPLLKKILDPPLLFILPHNCFLTYRLPKSRSIY